jgi:predicted Zn-dependent peptidase
MTVALAFPGPAGVDGEEAARRVLTEMMNARMGDIRFKLGATYGTYAGRAVKLGPGAYQAGATVDAERAGEALAAMREGIEQLRGDSEQWSIDFVRARRALIQQLLGESTVSYELATRLQTIDKFGLEADYYNELMHKIAAVSPAQVRALIKRELDPQKEIVVVKADQATMEKAFKEAGITDFKLVQPDYKQ